MTLSLNQLQAEHQEWAEHNFPNQAEHEALLGLIEELGELAHAHLKYEQGIRGYDEEYYRVHASDAVGDIMIYLASYCNRCGFNLQMCMEETWRRVRERDWQADPRGGVSR